MKLLQPKSRDAVLQIAAWQVGVLESPPGSNKVKYNHWYYGRNVSGSAYPWCMVFIQWVFYEAGFHLYKTASCTALANRYRNAGQWVESHYKPGDIVMFDWSGKKSKTEHVGIVERVESDGSLTTIEGNTSLGNESNGGAVLRRSRNLKFVTGACRPKYNL